MDVSHLLKENDSSVFLLQSEIRPLDMELILRTEREVPL
jgi:hypothetical protein